jgi:hypothetical protein
VAYRALPPPAGPLPVVPSHPPPPPAITDGDSDTYVPPFFYLRPLTLPTEDEGTLSLQALAPHPPGLSCRPRPLLPPSQPLLAPTDVDNDDDKGVYVPLYYFPLRMLTAPTDDRALSPAIATSPGCYGQRRRRHRVRTGSFLTYACSWPPQRGLSPIGPRHRPHALSSLSSFIHHPRLSQTMTTIRKSHSFLLTTAHAAYRRRPNPTYHLCVL